MLSRFSKEVLLRWIMWMVIDIVVTLLLIAIFPNVIVDTFIIATCLGCIAFCWCLEWTLHFLKVRKFKSYRWFQSVGGSISGAFVLGLIFLALGLLEG